MAKKGTAVVSVQDQLRLLQPRVAELLPSYMSPERFLRVARLILSRNPDLLDESKVQPMSVLSAVLDAARLGLDIGREAHLVKYGNQCVMLPDYRGLQKLALETGALRVIEARVVYEADDFEWEEGSTPRITHKPSLDGSRTDKDVKAFYSIAFFKDGTYTFLVRNPQQINHIRSKSRAKDSGPWKTDWQAMGMKTVIKEICDKRLLMLPNAEKLSAAIEMDNRAETGEVTRPLESDTDEQLRAQVADRTRQKAAELKDRLLGGGESETETTAEPMDDELAREEDRRLAEGK